MRGLPLVADVFVKRFFLTNISCTYTMNYFRQEKGFRDHGLRTGRFLLGDAKLSRQAISQQ